MSDVLRSVSGALSDVLRSESGERRAAAELAAAVPPLTRPRRARVPSVTEARLDSGLRVIAVRRPGVPLVEVRLRVPFGSARPTHPARATLLGETLLTGAGGLGRAGLAAAVQSLGAELSVGVDADRLLLSGSGLAANLRPLLALIATVLTEARFAAAEVATERDRLTERLTIARSRSQVVAAEALGTLLWGDHPYARDLPQPDAVAATTAAQLRGLYRAQVRPGDATLVLVGDLAPARIIDQVAGALAGWTGEAAGQRVLPLPDEPVREVRIIDRPGAVQSSVRLGAPAVGRSDPRYPALQLANLIFGGYFSSRWNENLREDKGYTYGAHSRVDQQVLGATLLAEADVATEVTAASWLETSYELGKIAMLPVAEGEVEAARQYAIGTLALSTSTQAGLASTLSALAPYGLGVQYLAQQPQRLSVVGVDQVSAAAAEFFAPNRFGAVIVGDAERITAPLRALGVDAAR